MKKIYRIIVSIVIILAISLLPNISKAVDGEPLSSVTLNGVYITSNAGEYKTGDKITFEARFSENIKKSTSSLPSLQIKIGETTRTMQASEESINGNILKFEHEIDKNEAGTVTFGNFNYGEDFVVLNSKDERAKVTNDVTAFKNSVELTVNSPKWTDFSKVTCKIEINNITENYMLTFGNVKLNEKSTYKVFLTNGGEKVDIKKDEHGKVTNAYSYLQDNGNINGNVNEIIEKTGKIYVYVVEEQIDYSKEGIEYITKTILEKTEVQRPAQRSLTQKINIKCIAEDVLGDLFVKEPVSKNRKIYITLGKVTDNSILSAIRNKESDGMSRLLTYAKKQNGIETYTITSDGSAVIELGDIETKILNKANLNEYYYLYYRVDDENGKYVDVEDIDLYQKSELYGKKYFWDINQSGFKWGDIDSTTETPKKDDNSNTEKPNTGNTEKPKDDTFAKDDKLPSTGLGIGLTLTIALVAVVAVVTFRKIKYYKDI